MLDMNEIHEEIAKLEKCDYTTYDLCRKLAILYIVRDHYKGSAGNVTSPVMPMSSMSTPGMTMTK